MRRWVSRGAALLAFVMPAAANLWLALHPAPQAQSKPLFAGAIIDPQALNLFQRACQNCHSENTEWPWYSRIPPASFLIRKDVDNARRHANFSKWDCYSVAEQQELLSKIGIMVRTGQMPLPRYTWLHRDAVLTAEERQQIYKWSKGERKRLGVASPDHR